MTFRKLCWTTMTAIQSREDTSQWSGGKMRQSRPTKVCLRDGSRSMDPEREATTQNDATWVSPSTRFSPGRRPHPLIAAGQPPPHRSRTESNGEPNPHTNLRRGTPRSSMIRSGRRHHGAGSMETAASSSPQAPTAQGRDEGRPAGDGGGEGDAARSQPEKMTTRAQICRPRRPEQP